MALERIHNYGVLKQLHVSEILQENVTFTILTNVFYNKTLCHSCLLNAANDPENYQEE